ncbi:hypothetical protein CMO88_01875 [Candidatus Woesearchaeota archaeon]|nr:hypothetical protein [Candidatus Woesearchaeota archaeon]|tara:strand:+ start:7786 stop:8319 length:534 start_codon:yes stop_codon:yes gene_type:complete
MTETKIDLGYNLSSISSEGEVDSEEKMAIIQDLTRSLDGIGPKSPEVYMEIIDDIWRNPNRKNSYVSAYMFDKETGSTVSVNVPHLRKDGLIWPIKVILVKFRSVRDSSLFRSTVERYISEIGVPDLVSANPDFELIDELLQAEGKRTKDLGILNLNRYLFGYRSVISLEELAMQTS